MVVATGFLSVACRAFLPQRGLTEVTPEKLAIEEDDDEKGFVFPFEYPMFFEEPHEHKVFLPMIRN